MSEGGLAMCVFLLSAETKEGVLTITLPKVEKAKAKSREVPIKCKL